MTARSRAGDRGLTHLGRGVRALRVIAALLLVLIAGLLLLQLSGGTRGRAGGTAVSLFQVCLASGQCVLCAAMTWWLWFRPPMTRVDADGVAVRTGPLRLEHVEWREVLRVEPEGPRTPVSRLVLRDGRCTPLPGLGRQDALWLAGVLADVQSRASSPT